MRSVVTFLSSRSRAEIEAFLGLHLPPLKRPIFEGNPDATNVYVNFYKNEDAQMEMLDTYPLIVERVGCPPLSVIADISGRIEGVKEATRFCICLLERFGGVAMDEYSDHLWTLAELQTGAGHARHGFLIPRVGIRVCKQSAGCRW